MESVSSILAGRGCSGEMPSTLGPRNCGQPTPSLASCANAGPKVQTTNARIPTHKVFEFQYIAVPPCPSDCLVRQRDTPLPLPSRQPVCPPRFPFWAVRVSTLIYQHVDRVLDAVKALRPRYAGLTALTASPRTRTNLPRNRRPLESTPKMLWSTKCSESFILKRLLTPLIIRVSACSPDPPYARHRERAMVDLLIFAGWVPPDSRASRSVLALASDVSAAQPKLGLPGQRADRGG